MQGAGPEPVDLGLVRDELGQDAAQSLKQTHPFRLQGMKGAQDALLSLLDADHGVQVILSHGSPSCSSCSR